MAITPTFDDRTGLVTLTVHGDVNGVMIKEALQGVLDDPRFLRGADMLWDFTHARGQDPKAEAVQDLASFVGSLKEKRGTGYRVALVANRDLEYGIARMYQAYAQTLPIVLRVFRDLDEARQWLGSKSPGQDAET